MKSDVNIWRLYEEADAKENKIIRSEPVLSILVGGAAAVVFLTDFGLTGVGLVTSISYYCAAGVLFTHFLKKDC